MGLIDDYREQMKGLLARGAAWARGVGTNMHKLIDGLAVEFSRVHHRADDLLTEMSPDGTVELLAEWEAVWGLPDACTGPLSTLADRRAALLARMTQVGQQSPGFFVQLAAELGYAITIEENVEGDPTVWRVSVPFGGDVVWARAGQATCGDPIRAWGVALLECAIKRVNPAHLVVLFAYAGSGDPEPGTFSMTVTVPGGDLRTSFELAYSGTGSGIEIDFGGTGFFSTAEGGLRTIDNTFFDAGDHVITISGDVPGIQYLGFRADRDLHASTFVIDSLAPLTGLDEFTSEFHEAVDGVGPTIAACNLDTLAPSSMSAIEAQGIGIAGDLGQIPEVGYLWLEGTDVTGSIDRFRDFNLTNLFLFVSPLVSGDLSNVLMPSVDSLTVTGGSCTYTSTSVSLLFSNRHVDISYCGLSESEVDQLIIDYDAGVTTGSGSLTSYGNAMPTSASAAALTSLESKISVIFHPGL